jgi:GT2 family glycosyltransferase
MKKITILIPVHNALAYTKKCLNSLKSQTGNICENFSIQTLVIDDGSSDGTTAWIQKEAQWVHLIPGDGNLWWTASINKGIEYALESIQSDYILWWNNDIIAEEDYFVRLIEILQEQKQDTVIGSKILIKDKPDTIWSMGGYFNPYNGKKYMIAQNEKDSDLYQKPLQVDWFPGMGTTFHKSVFEKTGLPDDLSFPQYHGDLDFSYRAKLAGFRPITFPQLRIYNDTGNTGKLHDNSFKHLIQSFSNKKSLYNIRKDILLYRKYAQSALAYKELITKYLRYIGGFIKWKILGFFARRKS